MPNWTHIVQLVDDMTCHPDLQSPHAESPDFLTKNNKLLRPCQEPLEEFQAQSFL